MTPNTMLDASGRVQHKSLFFCLLASICLTTFTITLKAEDKGDKKQPVIYWAEPNYTNGTIAIDGDNFGKQPTVELDGKSINVTSHTDQQIVVTMPAKIQTGTYLLKVSTGPG